MGNNVFGDEQNHASKGKGYMIKREFSFDWYLHETCSPDEIIDILVYVCEVPEDTARDISERKPFYEVTLHCVVDLDSGKVRIESAECS